MSKLIYFPVQGRAQAIRYLLESKGIAYEEQNVGGADWQALKQAKTYGDAQLPVMVAADGTFRTQSVAMLKSLAMEHGYAPQDATALYEMEWFFGTQADYIEPTMAKRAAYLKDAPTQEEIDAAIKNVGDLLARLDGQYADGRDHVAGSSITAADFYLLALVTAFVENPNMKQPSIREALTGKLAECANLQRILTPMRELCATSITNLRASSV